MRAPLDFRVLAKPLYLLMAGPERRQPPTPQRTPRSRAVPRQANDVSCCRSRTRTSAPSRRRSSKRLADAGPAAAARSACAFRRHHAACAHQRSSSAARAFTDRLGAPVMAVPGQPRPAAVRSVDPPAAALRPAISRPSAIDLEPVHRSPDLLVVCVNTTRVVAAQAWRGVGVRQIDRVARTLCRAPGPSQLRVVVVHQPVAVHPHRRCPEQAARARRSTAALGCRGRRPRHGRAHPPALRDGAARLGPAAVGSAGGHGRLVAGAPGRAQLGEPAALGRGLGAGLLPDRAMGLFGGRPGLCSCQGQRSPTVKPGSRRQFERAGLPSKKQNYMSV